MLEHVNLDQSLSKEEYAQRLPELQSRLYDLEHALFQAGIPAMVVFEGWSAAGKGSTINVLVERLDPRGCRVVPIMPPRTSEARYPWLWRFWQKVPARGQMVIYDTSWYRRVLIDRVERRVKKHEWQRAYQDIAEFEEQMAADGAAIVKFWLHISRKEQARRFKRLLKSELTAWQVAEEDAAQHAAYDQYLEAVEEMLARTEAPHAPWVIVEATDRSFTRIKALDTLIRAFEARLGDQAPPRVAPAAPDAAAAAPPPARKTRRARHA
jgi:polyphosphate kinase 2 (PPK2 family)